jgi:probable F420-dependent oxidoreductase
MRVGISVYDMRAADLVDLAVAADDAGFDAVWLGEHVVLPVGYASEHPTVDDGEAHQHVVGPIVSPGTELVDPLVALGAVAGATGSLRLATGMYILPLRHPLTTARATHTLHEASGGRFVLGVGAGWLQEEFAALGVPFDRRGQRLEETIEVLRKAWAGGPFEHRGAHFSFGPVQITERPADIALVMGGNTPRALRRAALLGDGWFSSGTPSLAKAVELRERLAAIRGAAGMVGPFRCYVRVEGCDPALLERYRGEGFDDVVVWADQVWPASGSPATRRAVMSEVARGLGLRPRRPDRAA